MNEIGDKFKYFTLEFRFSFSFCGWNSSGHRCHACSPTNSLSNFWIETICSDCTQIRVVSQIRSKRQSVLIILFQWSDWIFQTVTLSSRRKDILLLPDCFSQRCLPHRSASSIIYSAHVWNSFVSLDLSCQWHKSSQRVCLRCNSKNWIWIRFQTTSKCDLDLIWKNCISLNFSGVQTSLNNFGYAKNSEHSQL